MATYGYDLLCVSGAPSGTKIKNDREDPVPWNGGPLTESALLSRCDFGIGLGI